MRERSGICVKMQLCLWYDGGDDGSSSGSGGSRW